MEGEQWSRRKKIGNEVNELYVASRVKEFQKRWKKEYDEMGGQGLGNAEQK